MFQFHPLLSQTVLVSEDQFALAWAALAVSQVYDSGVESFADSDEADVLGYLYEDWFERELLPQLMRQFPLVQVLPQDQLFGHAEAVVDGDGSVRFVFFDEE